MGVKITRGVIGVTNHDGSSARCDDFLEFLNGRQGKARLDVARDSDNLGIAQLGEGVIVGVVRFRDDDFVARIEANGKSHLQSLATASGDDNLVRGHIDAVTVVIVAQSATIARDTSRVAVFQHTMTGWKILRSLSQSLQSSLRSFNVRLTDVKVIHMDATLFGGISKRNKFTDCRLRQFQTFFGYLWHKLLFLNKKPSNVNIRRLL